jgi:hypothetical protein
MCMSLSLYHRCIFGFKGTPLLLRVRFIFYKASLSWVCHKLGFGGIFVMVILVLKENGESF